MASTYSTNLAIELIGTGDQAGTWGSTTNSNLGTLIEQAISGYVTQAVSTGTDTTITIPNGSTGVARNMYIELTGTGGTNTNLIVPANKKLYFIFNNSTGAVTVKVTGQTGVSVPTGKKMVLVSNGTDIVNGLNYIADFGTNSFSVTNLTASSATITNLIATTASVSDLSATVSRSASATITNLIATSASITTLTNNPIFSAGTANGVLFLNGSKVATSGSALVFDGTNLGVGTSSPAYKLDLTSSNDGYGRQWISSVGYPSSADGSAGFQIRNLGAAVGGLKISNYANSVEWVRIDTSGNVGIGTASPGSVGVSGYTRLVLGAGSGATDGLTIVPSGTGGVQFTDAANVKKGYLQWDSSTGALALGTAGTTKATLDSSGNLLVGSGISGARLSIRDGGSNDSYFGLGANYDVYISSGSSGTHYFRKGSSSAMTLDASGNLAVGDTTNSAAARLYVKGSGATSGSVAMVVRNSTPADLLYIRNDGYTGFGLNATAMVLNESGSLLVGTTTPAGYRLRVYDGSAQFTQGNSASDCADCWNRATTGDNGFLSFYTEGTATGRGSINYNRAGGLTSYNTTSDYRAKDVYGLLDDSGETIDALKVYRGKMHGATMERPMLIAHEAQEVAPYAVTGEKDAVNDDGNPIYQQMDTSSLVPLLIAEIQSLRSRVAALEAK